MSYHKFTTFVFALFMLGVSHAAIAQNTLSYALHVDKKPYGTIQIKHRKQNNGHYQLEQETSIKIKSFWGDVNFYSTLEEQHDSNGTLLQSSNTIKENDKTFWTKIEKSGEEFLAFKSELTNDSQKEDTETVDLAKGVVVHLVPGAGQVMMIGEFLLSDENKQPKNNRFTADSFDSTFLNIPTLWQKSGYTLPQSLRIFDTEEMYIFQADIVYKGAVKIDISEKTVQAKHYEMHATDADTVRIWLAHDKKNKPHFVQISGKDGGDLYKIILSSEPPDAKM